MTLRTAALAGAFLGLTWVGLDGMYVQREIARVPVTRLLENLQRELQRDSKNTAVLVNLARLHGMAYALKATEVPAVVTGKGEHAPWYGNEPNPIPYTVTSAFTASQAKEAAMHLASALDHYQKAIALDSTNLLALIGYGWTLEQSGDRGAAITQYRKVVELAWPRDQQGERFGYARSFTEEAADYLVKLLDPIQDAKEIKALDGMRARISALPRTVTPIVVPLEEGVDVAEIADTYGTVRFDADGSGLRLPWTWITPHAGWLVYDADGRGHISSSLEWFGSVTFWLFWSHGYEALRALDDNDDGELAGTELGRLSIWRDRNRNGMSESGEVRPLGQHGIVALSCRFELGDGYQVAAWSAQGARFRGGLTRPTYDVILRTRRSALTDELSSSVNNP